MNGERRASRKKSAKKMATHVDEGADEDPYLLLGFGMIAYRDLMKTLILIFTLFTLLMIPAFIFYTG